MSRESGLNQSVVAGTAAVLELTVTLRNSGSVRYFKTGFKVLFEYSNMKRIVLRVLLVAIVGGLGLLWFLDRPTAMEKSIDSQFWTLLRLKSGGEQFPLPADAEVTFESAGDRRYVGTAAVNSYEVHLRIDRQGQVAFIDNNEGGGVTEMAGPGHLMDVEAAYLAAFWRIRDAEVSGSRLWLRGPGVELEYEGQPARSWDASGSPGDPVSTTAAEAGQPGR